MPWGFPAVLGGGWGLASRSCVAGLGSALLSVEVVCMRALGCLFSVCGVKFLVVRSCHCQATYRPSPYELKGYKTPHRSPLSNTTSKCIFSLSDSVMYSSTFTFSFTSLSSCC